MPRAAEDEAGIAAAAQRQADARRLLPAELEEVSEMSALVPPRGPGIVLGRGMRKLLGAVDGLGKLRAGATADYRRDPATEGGPPSFVSGDTADPDGRITVTADGLLEVTKTKRTPQKAKKGQPALPPKVTHETVLVDLQGKKVALKEGQVVADVFFAQAKSAEERAAAARILVTLRASDAPIAGGTGEGSELTLGELVTEASSGTFRQVSYLDKAKTERSELLKKVMRAFDQIRAEFEAFEPPTTLALFTTYPSHDQLARAFAPSCSRRCS